MPPIETCCVFRQNKGTTTIYKLQCSGSLYLVPSYQVRIHVFDLTPFSWPPSYGHVSYGKDPSLCHSPVFKAPQTPLGWPQARVFLFGLEVSGVDAGHIRVLRWSWQEIDGFHWFRWVRFHWTGKPIYFQPKRHLWLGFFFRGHLGRASSGESFFSSPGARVITRRVGEDGQHAWIIKHSCSARVF